ncbi:CHAT domain-containing protein [Nodosilinea sp. E11]|uniref:CHAT domain-containing protein n=1 Tax=Nodosilinea sp. E11 TaxID=3037479 RepID=UPI002934DCF9|nr:CHAT domain-containing protein [Nodosilinea sp. E11]WOD41482.1 CHAT domain-containing protein [Nodosilinea sp. E11]
MALELNLRFPNPSQVVIKLEEEESEALAFESPLDVAALAEIRWYLEVYSVQYTADVDDRRAEAIEANLKAWGEALFTAVFSNRAAQRLFNTFQDSGEAGRLITISARHPAILGLPWELLRDPAGTYLLHETPRISVRRRLAGAGGGRRAYRFQPQEQARILFVVSRPSDAGFMDPRSEAQAVLRAIAAEAAGRVEAEFLRPATLDALVQRLEDDRLPQVDILHFDGHGVYDADGHLWEAAKRSDALLLTKGSRQEAQDMGYLLFEDAEGKAALISAETLGDMLHRQRIGLVVLSACQSAAVGQGAAEDDPTAADAPGVLGSLAARLTHGGIPAVLAMTHSVLVTATEALFGQFYQYLGRGQGMGEALDNARRYLYRHTERGTRLRGQQQEITLRLQDWFLPALYQAGADTPLLTNRTSRGAQQYALPGNDGTLPDRQEAGFWGRSRELWQIERAFVGGTRRLSITGFGGQGKTYLALEAGRWLHQTGMFERVCFVDYAAYQGQAPVSYAVSTLATVLEHSLLDAAAATAHLGQTPTLVILDNLEALEPEPQRRLLEAAKAWSEAGHSRVLLTTRQPTFAHPAYPTEGSRQHLALPLRGLGSTAYPNDALAYFRALWALPPTATTPTPDRAALVKLFALVDFHPLSIGLLARQLKERRIAEVGTRLAELLQTSPVQAGEAPNPLVASLLLSLDRLDDQARQWLPKLGVFQGGAMEDVLLSVTGLGQADEDPEIAQGRQLLAALQANDPWATARAIGLDLPENAELPEELIQQIQQFAQQHVDELAEILANTPQSELADGADETTWPALRQALESTGLIQAEYIPGIGVPYLKFHPTLAPMLWAQVSPAAQSDLQTRHRQRYYQLSGWLYQQDRQNPLEARTIARRELPNLMQAVNQAIAAADPDAVAFGDNVNLFLNVFGLGQDRQALTQKLAALQGEVGSRNWYLARSNQGEGLMAAGRYDEARQVFAEVLQGLGETPSYERCLTLGRIGRCLEAQGQAAQAAQRYREGIAVAEQLEQSDGVKRQRGALHTDLGDVLTAMGDYAGAKEAYEEGLKFIQAIGDERSVAAIQGQLGTLALVQGDLAAAATRYRAALTTFQGLGEPATEAVAWHQLGVVYQRGQQWDEAERHYREAARIKEERGDVAGAAQTWNNLALVNKGAGRVDGAIAWYEKAIAGGKAVGDQLGVSKRLNNLADLLQSQPHPSAATLATARHHAEAALAIKRTLDPAAAQIWNTYTILAKIAEQQGQADQARTFRQQARQAKAAFAGTQHELRQHGQLIAAVVMASLQPDQQAQLDPILQQRESSGWTNLVAAIRRILNGERDESLLWDSLDMEDSMIVSAILRGIADPNTLQALLGDE